MEYCSKSLEAFHNKESGAIVLTECISHTVQASSAVIKISHYKQELPKDRILMRRVVKREGYNRQTTCFTFAEPLAWEPLCYCETKKLNT